MGLAEDAHIAIDHVIHGGTEVRLGGEKKPSFASTTKVS
jgi:hypothetical protein